MPKLVHQSLPDSFKKSFLIEFTKELIRNSAREKIIEPKKVIIPAENIISAKIPFAPKIEEKPLQIPAQVEVLKIPVVPALEREAPAVFSHQKIIPPAVLRIPEQRLPETFQYLRPYSTAAEIDLGKLNSLIKDPNVKTIECNGPNENITVEGTMGRKFTEILLNKEEINEVIRKFSEKSKIPVSTGTYKMVVGRLIFMAVISDIINSKFVIKKMI